MMKSLALAATAAFAVAGSAFAAEPVAPPTQPIHLDEAQMDDVSAGLLNNISIAVPINVVTGVNVAAAIGVFSNNTSATANQILSGTNVINVAQSLFKTTP